MGTKSCSLLINDGGGDGHDGVVAMVIRDEGGNEGGGGVGDGMGGGADGGDEDERQDLVVKMVEVVRTVLAWRPMFSPVPVT